MSFSCEGKWVLFGDSRQAASQDGEEVLRRGVPPVEELFISYPRTVSLTRFMTKEPTGTGVKTICRNELPPTAIKLEF